MVYDIIYRGLSPVWNLNNHDPRGVITISCLVLRMIQHSLWGGSQKYAWVTMQTTNVLYMQIFFPRWALSQCPTSFVYLFCCPFVLFCFSLSIDISIMGGGIYRENIGMLGVEPVWRLNLAAFFQSRAYKWSFTVSCGGGKASWCSVVDERRYFSRYLRYRTDACLWGRVVVWDDLGDGYVILMWNWN